MTSSNDLGKKGENIAKNYLRSLGYSLIACNYRCRYGEIDIIAQIYNTVSFIEVKTRRSISYGEPEEAVDTFKIEKIKKTAKYFISNKKLYGHEICFDVISIKYRSGKYLLGHIKNAF